MLRKACHPLPEVAVHRRTRIACFLVVLVVTANGASAAAASPSEPSEGPREPTPLANSIARAAVTLAQSSSERAETARIPRKYLWTGVALLAAGGLSMVSGALMSESRFGCADYVNDEHCRDVATVSMVTGAAVAGAGAFVLVGGSHRREPPSNHVVSVGRRSVQWRIRY
jgi:hypothetical protein